MEAKEDDLLITSPLQGTFLNLSQVNDPVFSQELLGKGIAVIPSEGRVYAPFDGSVAMLFQTAHAIGLVSDDQLELLIHIGIDTVNLQGKHFTPLVKTNDRFRKGDVLLEFDVQAIQEEGYEITTPVIVTNVERFAVEVIEAKEVGIEEYIFYIKQKDVN